MYWSNGEKTYGYWQNNFLHGTAIFTEAPDGKRYEVPFAETFHLFLFIANSLLIR